MKAKEEEEISQNGNWLVSRWKAHTPCTQQDTGCWRLGSRERDAGRRTQRTPRDIGVLQTAHQQLKQQGKLEVLEVRKESQI